MSKLGFFPLAAAAGQMAAMVITAAAAIATVGATTLAFLGLLPWPDVALVYGDAPIPWSGQALQIAMTVLLVVLTLTLPSAWKVTQLELSHRTFQVDMDDITRAYRAAHMADRAEMFEMQREFDAVRERYIYLKSLPELDEMDAELLTIAAQMSEQSREMAAIYSKDKVARAKESLKQRFRDAEELQERIQEAHASVREIRRLMDDVDIEESTVAAQLQWLREEMSQLEGVNPDPDPGKRKAKPHLKSV